MNVTTHQKKKNERTKKSKEREKKKRKQATDFEEAVCCPTVVVQGAPNIQRLLIVAEELMSSLGLKNTLNKLARAGEVRWYGMF